MIISPRGKPRGDFSTDYVNFLCYEENPIDISMILLYNVVSKLQERRIDIDY